MKYLLGIFAALAVLGFFGFVGYQDQKREADEKWNQFVHKQDNRLAAKNHTTDMKLLWLKKHEKPSAEDLARWEKQEARECQ